MKYKIILLLLISSVSTAQISGKFIKLNSCVLQISDSEETKYSGKQYLNLSKIERIMTALNHIELMQNSKGIIIMANSDEKQLIIDAFISCSK